MSTKTRQATSRAQHLQSTCAPLLALLFFVLFVYAELREDARVAASALRCGGGDGGGDGGELLPHALQRRYIYIDGGANWANTMRLYKDIDSSMAHLPWEVHYKKKVYSVAPFRLTIEFLFEIDFCF